MKCFLIFLVIAAASASSFMVHLLTAEWLPAWVGTQMEGITIQPSWEVRYIAGVTSFEYGIAAMGLYYFSRDKLLQFGKVKSAVLFSILLMAVHGAFLRQPLMDYTIGNPIHVVLVQNSFQWLIWIIMSFYVVLGTEFIIKSSSTIRK